MKRECWGCNRIFTPVMSDGEETCPYCGCIDTFGTAERTNVAAVLAMLALYAVETPSPWPVLR